MYPFVSIEQTSQLTYQIKKRHLQQMPSFKSVSNPESLTILRFSGSPPLLFLPLRTASVSLLFAIKYRCICIENYLLLNFVFVIELFSGYTFVIGLLKLEHMLSKVNSKNMLFSRVWIYSLILFYKYLKQNIIQGLQYPTVYLRLWLYYLCVCQELNLLTYQ